MSNNLSKITKIAKKDYKKRLVKDIKTFPKKEKKQQYGCERYKNLSEDEIQRIVEYRKKFYKVWKNKNASKTNNDALLT